LEKEVLFHYSSSTKLKMFPKNYRMNLNTGEFNDFIQKKLKTLVC
jgi:hypothetical protein